MNTIINWFIDFDDTLASGPTTWGLEYALPRLIHEHSLPLDQSRYDAAVLTAQERVNRETDLKPILNDLFDSQNWPRELQVSLLTDMQHNYRASLFPDSVEFLQFLRLQRKRVFVLSNNPTAPDLAKALGLDEFVDGYFTPKLCPGCLPKPDSSMWSFITNLNATVTATNSVIIGDDPWSDALFAQRCGLPYWIIDRKSRFSHIADLQKERLVTSLLELTRTIV